MVKVTTIDTSGLARLIQGLSYALIGTGKNGDLSQVVSDETRRLAMEIGRAPTAKQRKKLQGSIRRDIGSVFLASPRHAFSGSQREGHGITWLMAGPNFLVGAPDAAMFDQTSMDGSLAKSLLYGLRGKLPSDKYSDAGMHGTQHVKIANRMVVKRGVVSRLFNELKKRVGRRDASFAETAQALGETKIPAQTKAHFPTNKNITQLTGLSNAENPSVTFGSKATGVAGLTMKVKRAVNVRRRAMAARLRLILTGYAGDHRRGAGIRRHGRD